MKLRKIRGKTQVWASSIRERFTGRLSFLEDYAKRAVDKGYEQTVTSILSIGSDLIRESVKKENKQLQGFLVKQIIQTQKGIYTYAVENGMQVSFFGVIDLGRLIDSLGQEDIETVGEFLLVHYCNSARTAVENDIFRGLHELGVLGRTIVEDNPSLAVEVVSALRECLELVSEEGELQNIELKMVVEQIESIHGWQNHNHSEVNQAIEDIYSDFDITVDEILGESH